MAGAPVTLSEVIRYGIGRALEGVFVARAGKVTVYDPLTNTAVVKPMVKTPLFKEQSDEREYEELPEIPFVPVIFPRAGGHAITFPIVPGDSVLLVFCDVGHAEWRDGGGLSEPVDVRRHQGYPVAIPGFYPDTSPLSPDPLDVASRTAGTVVGETSGANRVEIDATGIRLGKGATEFVASGTRVDALLAAIMAWNPVANDGGAALKTAITTFLGTTPSMSFVKTKAT